MSQCKSALCPVHRGCWPVGTGTSTLEAAGQHGIALLAGGGGVEMESVGAWDHVMEITMQITNQQYYEVLHLIFDISCERIK